MDELYEWVMTHSSHAWLWHRCKFSHQSYKATYSLFHLKCYFLVCFWVWIVLKVHFVTSQVHCDSIDSSTKSSRTQISIFNLVLFKKRCYLEKKSTNRRKLVLWLFKCTMTQSTRAPSRAVHRSPIILGLRSQSFIHFYLQKKVPIVGNWCYFFFECTPISDCQVGARCTLKNKNTRSRWYKVLNLNLWSRPIGLFAAFQ